jgi:predicted ribosomally synthesized peptide with SipW-like signal peptide
MKKFLILILAMVLALGMMGGAFAYFSDTETSEDNVFTAGTLDLLVTADGVKGSPFGAGAVMVETPGGNGENCKVVFTNLSPGDNGFIYWTITNVGSIPGSLDISFTRAADNDNGITEPEDWADGIKDNLDGTADGDLDNRIRIQIKADLDNNGLYETTLQNGSGEGEFATYPLGTPVEKLSDFSLNPGQTIKVFFEFRLNTDVGGPTVDDNIIQGDSMELDVAFELLQNAD